MKLGILTFHDGINFGAFAQVYSMQCALETLGHEVTVINYKNFGHWFQEYKGFYFTKRISNLVNNTRKIRKFHAIQKSHLHTGAFHFRMPRRNPFGIEAVVVGADEVWNFQTKLIGEDPSYFVPRLEGARYVAYAPSFGSVPAGTDLPANLAQGLRQFSSISVRDTNSQGLVARNLGTTPPIVLDPTFLFPCHQQAVPSGLSGYWLYYSADIPAEHQQQVLQFAHSRGKKLVAIGYKAPWADENIIDMDPFEWMGWIRDAELVFTTMFHGTIYSILQHSPFITMMTPYRRNKLHPMMGELGLEGRIVNLDADLPASFARVAGEAVDWNAVDSRIAARRESSLEYLRGALAKPGRERA